MKLTYFLNLIFVFIISSCSINKDSYNFVHKNIGETSLDHVTVSFHGFNSACGILYPGMTKHHQMVDKHGNVPEKVDIQWNRVQDGQKFNKILKLRSRLPQNPFHGDIIFLFDNEHVQLTWMQDHS